MNGQPDPKEERSDKLDKRTEQALQRAATAAGDLESVLQSLASRAHEQLRKPKQGGRRRGSN